MNKETEKLKNIENAVGDFQPIPFYFVNDNMDKKEVLRQLDFMKEKGIKGFFFHVRDGITDQAYGTDYFFECVKFVIAEAAKRGIKVWLYDEDAYPSGNCGGLIVMDHPELQMRNLRVQKLTPDEKGMARFCIGKGIGLCGYILTREGDKEKVKRVNNGFGAVRRTWYKRKLDKHYFPDMADLHFEHTRGATCYTEVMFETKAPANAEVYCVYLQPVNTDVRFGTLANTLDRRATDIFIERVHEKYRQYVGEYFGNVIPGIFLDEPATGGELYCEEFEEFFEKKFGYPAREHFYKLSSEYEGDGAQFRRDYAKAVSDLFRKNFLQPLKDWCEKNGLIFTGHFAGEENLSTQAHGGNLYRAIGMMDLPGMDLIGNDIGDLEHCSLLLGSKIVSSAAWQNGKDVIMSESFALNPYNFGYRGMKLNADWMFAGGVNLIVPHGFHYGYSAFRRADAGKSFFFQDPLFPEYERFSAYAGRVGKLLHEYRAKNEVLVVLPLGACSEELLKYRKNALPVASERMRTIMDRVYNVTKLLHAYHVDWDITYPDSIADAVPSGGNLVLKGRTYKQVIIIEGGEEELAVYKRLNGAVKDLVYCSFPQRLALTDCVLVAHEGDSKHLLVLKKYSDEGELYFIFNNSRTYVQFSMNAQEHMSVYDAENDRYLTLGKGRRIALNGYESIILLTKEVKCTDKYQMPEEEEVVLEYKDAPQLIYLPVGGERAVVDFDLTVRTDEGEKKYEKVGFSRLRDVLGTVDDLYKTAYMVPYFDDAPRIRAPYPVYARYTAKVEKGEGGILFDKDTINGEYRLCFNGKEISKEDLLPKRVYDASNLIFYPEWQGGENILEVVFEKGEEFDGINGEFFVMQKEK